MINSEIYFSDADLTSSADLTANDEVDADGSITAAKLIFDFGLKLVAGTVDSSGHFSTVGSVAQDVGHSVTVRLEDNHSGYQLVLIITMKQLDLNFGNLGAKFWAISS